MRLTMMSVVIVMSLFSSSCIKFSEQKMSYNYDQALLVADVPLHPVIVMGGGVAGLTAANYMAQANIPSLLLEGAKPGGALAQSDSVRNWPGEIALPGMAIIKKLKDQVLAAGVTISPEEVIHVDFACWPYSCQVRNVQTNAVRTIKMLSCIIALGAEPHYLKIPGEQGIDGYWGKGVTNCAVCDGSLYRGKNVAVVGGGDSAIVEALYLAGIAKQVTVFVRKNSLRAKDLRNVARAQQHNTITFVFNTIVTKIVGDGKQVTGLELRNTKTGNTETRAMDGLFLALGASPNTKLFSKQLVCDELGYIVVTEGQRANLPGVFAAGDCADPVYKQAVTSASDGCKAALNAQEFLRTCGYVGNKGQEAAENSVLQVPVNQIDGIVEIDSTEAFILMLNKQQRPMVIDIYANLCVDCQKIEPMIQKMAQLFNGTIMFVRVNANNKAIDPDAIMKVLGGAALMQVPTLLFIKNGKEVGRLDDAISEAALRENSNKIL